MSSDLPTGAPSPQTDSTTSPQLALTVRDSGAGLLASLDQHLPGFAARAATTSDLAVVAAVGLGFPPSDADLCRETARLHDVGLIYVPSQIAARDPRDLTPNELVLYEGHFQAGARLAAGVGVPEVICGWMAANAEWFNGNGPGGMSGTAIPVVSRIARAARECERILTRHGEAGGLAVAATGAVDELRGRAGADLDPAIVQCLASGLTATK